jgi:hypothetical protein
MYYCECNNTSCKFTLEEEAWIDAFQAQWDAGYSREMTSILHPECSTQLIATVLKKTDRWVLVKCNR